jgi:hypothetical protein
MCLKSILSIYMSDHLLGFHINRVEQTRYYTNCLSKDPYLIIFHFILEFIHEFNQ